jgi:hypothetical protein
MTLYAPPWRPRLFKHCHHAAIVEGDDEILEEVVSKQPVKWRFVHPELGERNETGGESMVTVPTVNVLSFPFDLLMCQARLLMFQFRLLAPLPPIQAA